MRARARGQLALVDAYASICDWRRPARSVVIQMYGNVQIGLSRGFAMALSV